MLKILYYIVDWVPRGLNPSLRFVPFSLPLRFIRKNPGRCDVFVVKSTSQANDDVVIVGKKRSVFDVSSLDVAGPFILSIARK